tara:strand:+ start:766 stop:915 length:150 start_codon:yes stop_codon:yes gene_type:complete
MGGSSGFPSFLSSNMGERLIIIEKGRHILLALPSFRGIAFQSSPTFGLI